MKRPMLLVIAVIAIVICCTSGASINIIYDTDLASDSDDAGSLALLENMSRMNQINLVAIIVDSENIYSAPCAYAFNKYYGQDDIIRIGAYKGIVPGGASASSSVYTQNVTNAFGIYGETYANYSNSTTIYRQILASSQNNSIIVIADGYYGALAELLKSQPDSISSLNGTELVSQKVIKLVSVAGFYPASSAADSQGGPEWNFKMDPANASYVFTNWPVAIDSVGIELGDTVYSAPPSTIAPASSPTRYAYNAFIGNNTRQSWGALGVIYATSQNPYEHFTLVGVNGTTTINSVNGSNSWSQTPAGKHSYLEKKSSDAALTTIINSTILSPPISAPATFNRNNGQSSVKINKRSKSIQYNASAYGVGINTTIYIDGSPMAVIYSNQTPTSDTWGTGLSYENSDVVVRHDYDKSTNNTLKETIIIKTPHAITYPYSLSSGASIYPYAGGYKVVRGSTSAGSGIHIKAPSVTNKTGGVVPASYSLSGGSIILTINDAGQEYPLTIDPTFTTTGGVYSNSTCFNVNLTNVAGAQTNYPILVNMTNTSGTSGNGIVYTGGLTRADWKDVGFANETGAVAFWNWRENGTETTTSSYWWVNVPSVATDNSTRVCAYFGNSSASSENGNFSGLNTFTLFDDFLGSSVNTSQWKAIPLTGGTIAVSGGAVTLSETLNEQITLNTTSTYGINISIRSRMKTLHSKSTSYTESAEATALPLSNYTGHLAMYSHTAAINNGNYSNYNGAAHNYGVIAGWEANTYKVTEIIRNGTTSAIFTVNGSNAVSISSGYTTNAVYPAYEVAGNGASESIDWVAVRKRVFPEPTTSNFSVVNESIPVESLNASFTDAPDPSSVGQSVTFTDTSTGSPTTWNWTFGDIGGSNTSTSQNPTHTYTTAGNYTVLLNVSNSTGSFSEASDWHNVSNASAFTPQDVWMEGQYNRTFHITSASDGTPLAANYITSDGQSGTASVLGYAFVTEGFGIYTITVSITGYATKTVSFVVDEDGTTEIQLTETSNVIKQQNTWYSPHQVRLEVWNSYGNKMQGIIVNATANESSMPDNWLTDLYGIEPGVADDMVNHTLIMEATTGGDGAVVYTMHGAISYDIRMTNPQTGATFFQTLMPKNDEYVLRMQTTSAIPNQTANIYNRLKNTSLTFSEPNNSYVTMGLQYQDEAGLTSSLNFYVYFDNNKSVVYTSNLGNPGTAKVYANYTTRNIRGVRYIWNYTAVRS